MKKKFKLTIFAAGVLFVSGLALTNASVQTAHAKSFKSPVIKIAGNKNYAIYHRVSKNGPSGKFTSTKYFKYGIIQSKKYQSTKKGNFWDIYVDGRHVGWVSQNFFARNEISVAKEINVVANPYYKFKTKDAINYATDSQGTAVSNSKVKVSKSYITDKPATVEYSYGKAKKSVQVNTYDASAQPELDQAKGPKVAKSWSGKNRATTIKSRTYKSNGLTLNSKFFQPITMSLGNAVGSTPEGTSYRSGIFASTRQKSHSQYGRVVTFNLNHIKSKTAASNLNNLSWGTFKSYASNIKVTPSFKVGHGQSIGQSANYIYVMANDNKYKRDKGPAAEEIFQIRKSDMKINKVWTFKISDPENTTRYIHNACFVGDDTMYALYHNGFGWYEIYKLSLQGNKWVPKEVASTSGNLAKGGPVQGFTYGGGHFYVAFNDVIQKLNSNGSANKTYKFNLHRETEGLSYSGGRLYIQFICPRELAVGTPK